MRDPEVISAMFAKMYKGGNLIVSAESGTLYETLLENNNAQGYRLQSHLYLVTPEIYNDDQALAEAVTCFEGNKEENFYRVTDALPTPKPPRGSGNAAGSDEVTVPLELPGAGEVKVIAKVDSDFNVERDEFAGEEEFREVFERIMGPASGKLGSRFEEVLEPLVETIQQIQKDHGLEPDMDMSKFVAQFPEGIRFVKGGNKIIGYNVSNGSLDINVDICFNYHLFEDSGLSDNTLRWMFFHDMSHAKLGAGNKGVHEVAVLMGDIEYMWKTFTVTDDIMKNTFIIVGAFMEDLESLKDMNVKGAEGLIEFFAEKNIEEYLHLGHEGITRIRDKAIEFVRKADVKTADGKNLKDTLAVYKDGVPDEVTRAIRAAINRAYAKVSDVDVYINLRTLKNKNKLRQALLQDARSAAKVPHNWDEAEGLYKEAVAVGMEVKVGDIAIVGDKPQTAEGGTSLVFNVRIKGDDNAYEITVNPETGEFIVTKASPGADENQPLHDYESMLRNEFSLENCAEEPGKKGWTWTRLHKAPISVYKCEYGREDYGTVLYAKYVKIPIGIAPTNISKVFERLGNRFVNTTIVKNLSYYEEDKEQIAPVAYVQDGKQVMRDLLLILSKSADPTDEQRARDIIDDYLNMLQEMWEVGLSLASGDIRPFNACIGANDKVCYFDLERFGIRPPSNLESYLGRTLKGNLFFLPRKFRAYFEKQFKKRLTPQYVRKIFDTKAGAPIHPACVDILVDRLKTETSTEVIKALTQAFSSIVEETELDVDALYRESNAVEEDLQEWLEPLEGQVHKMDIVRIQRIPTELTNVEAYNVDTYFGEEPENFLFIKNADGSVTVAIYSLTALNRELFIRLTDDTNIQGNIISTLSQKFEQFLMGHAGEVDADSLADKRVFTPYLETSEQKQEFESKLELNPVAKYILTQPQVLGEGFALSSRVYVIGPKKVTATLYPEYNTVLRKISEKVEFNDLTHEACHKAFDNRISKNVLILDGLEEYLSTYHRHIWSTVEKEYGFTKEENIADETLARLLEAVVDTVSSTPRDVEKLIELGLVPAWISPSALGYTGPADKVLTAKYKQLLDTKIADLSPQASLQQAFSKLDEIAKKELESPLSTLSGTRQRIKDVSKLRLCVPADVLKNSADITLTLNRLGDLRGAIPFKLVATGVKEEDIELINSLNRSDIKKALNLPENLTVSMIKENEIQERAKLTGINGTDPKIRTEIVKLLSQEIERLTPGECMAIATDAVYDKDKEKLKEQLRKKLEDNISIRVLVKPETGKSMFSISSIINSWLKAIQEENDKSTIGIVLPVLISPAEMIERLDSAIRAAWKALSSA